MLSTSALRLPTQHINKTEWYKKKYQSNTLSLLDLCFLCVFLWFDLIFKKWKIPKKFFQTDNETSTYSVPPSIGVTCFGDAKHQAQSINKSLTALGDVIEVGLDRGFLSDVFWVAWLLCLVVVFSLPKTKKASLPLKTCFFSTKIVCFLKFLLKKNVCCSFS